MHGAAVDGCREEELMSIILPDGKYAAKWRHGMVCRCQCNIYIAQLAPIVEGRI